MNNDTYTDFIIEKLSNELLQVSSTVRDDFIRVIDILKAYSDIIGVLLGGSLSRGKMDCYSDVDLFCLCSPNKHDSIKATLLNKLQELECVEQVVEQGSFAWLGETITLYFSSEMYFSIDIGIVEFAKGQLFFWEPTGVILWDDNNIITNGQIASRQLVEYKKFPFSSQFPVRHSVVLLQKLKKNLLRNHLWNCIEYLGKLRRNLIFLLRIHVVKDDDFLGNPDRNIEDVFPRDILDRLNKTQPSIDQIQIAEATFLVTDWLVEIVDQSIIRYETDDNIMTTWLLKELSSSREWFINFLRKII